MSVTIRVPPVFRTMTSGSAQVDVEGATISEVLSALESQHPGFSDKLFDDSGSLVRCRTVSRRRAQLALVLQPQECENGHKSHARPLVAGKPKPKRRLRADELCGETIREI